MLAADWKLKEKPRIRTLLPLQTL